MVSDRFSSLSSETSTYEPRLVPSQNGDLHLPSYFPLQSHQSTYHIGRRNFHDQPQFSIRHLLECPYRFSVAFDFAKQETSKDGNLRRDGCRSVLEREMKRYRRVLDSMPGERVGSRGREGEREARDK